MNRFVTGWVRWSLVIVFVGHGVVHLLGAAEGLGWAEVAQLHAPISTLGGLAWLVSALLVLAAAVALGFAGPSWWWPLAGIAAITSESVVLTSWSDAYAGSVVNILLAVVAASGFAFFGPYSLHAQWETRSAAAVAECDPAVGLVTERELDGLPEPLATYLRRSGAVGAPKVTTFRARIHGRIRGGVGQRWMPFTGRQVSTYGPQPQRLVIMDATSYGLPVVVLHDFHAGAATMRGKLLSVLTVVDAAGPAMSRAESVTLFNDLVVLAPAAVVGAPIRWTAIDAHHVSGAFTVEGETVEARLAFDLDGDLVDFVSDDRLRSSSDGKAFIRQRWSTPVGEYRYLGERRVATTGEGRWVAPSPEGPFTYIEFHVDDIVYGSGSGSRTDRPREIHADSSALSKG